MAISAHIYMSIFPVDGDNTVTIKGESTDYFYEGDIELEGWNWDLERRNTPVQSEDGYYVGATAGKLKFSKLLDTATTEMLGYMRRGERISEIQVNMMQHVLAEAQTGGQFGVTLTFEDVWLTSYGVSASGDFSMTFKEDWELEYKQVTFDYMPFWGARNWNLDMQRAESGEAEGSGTTSLIIPRVPDFEAEDKKKKAATDAKAGTSPTGSAAPVAGAHTGSSAGGGGGATTGGATSDLDAHWQSSRRGHSGEGVPQPRRY